MKPEIRGLVLALLSSAIGGTAIVATRALVATIDPVLLGALRFGIGVLALWPIAVWSGQRWPSRSDLPSVVALGLLFFAAFPILFNLCARR
ncbi:EamA family transporter [Polymorphobacter multimanifer]|uniref:EamA family transporter n=1 Tax=Polymorphobacter multimanifer TaxID=1070431 RepID=UPI001617AB47